MKENFAKRVIDRNPIPYIHNMIRMSTFNKKWEKLDREGEKSTF
jgi:hypothetical protein